MTCDQKGVKKLEFGTKHPKKLQKMTHKLMLRKNAANTFPKSFLLWQSCAIERAGAGAAHIRGFTGDFVKLNKSLIL